MALQRTWRRERKEEEGSKEYKQGDRGPVLYQGRLYQLMAGRQTQLPNWEGRYIFFPVI